MAITSIAGMEALIMKAMQQAVQKAQDYVYDVLSDFMDAYYSEYEPSVYERTHQMLNSLVRSEVISTGNGYEAHVWFDAGLLDYSTKNMTKIQTDNGDYVNPYNGAISPDGVFNNPYGSGDASLEAAMHGSHGGKAAGVAVWDRSMAIFDANLIQKLKSYLIAAGIPLA